MTVDLLDVFERAGAKKADRNLSFAFDFGRELPGLNFDLSHFRKWAEVWRRLEVKYSVGRWDIESLLALYAAIGERYVAVSDPTMSEWAEEYFDSRTWPDFLPPTESGFSKLDIKLVRVWGVWEEVVRESPGYHKEREKLWKCIYDRGDSETLKHKNDVMNGRWPLELLGSIDLDHWAGKLAHGTYAKVEKIKKLPEDKAREEVERFQESIDSIFWGLHEVETKMEILVKEIREFLNLPV